MQLTDSKPVAEYFIRFKISKYLNSADYEIRKEDCTVEAYRCLFNKMMHHLPCVIEYLEPELELSDEFADIYTITTKVYR